MPKSWIDHYNHGRPEPTSRWFRLHRRGAGARGTAAAFGFRGWKTPMPDFDAGYTQKHVDECGEIIDDLFSALAALPDTNRSDEIRKAVKWAVVKLNKLNDKCDGSLIETDQREDLCALLLGAAKTAGLESADGEDITEEWREW